MGLDKAITAAGSQAALARLLNVTDMAVSQWKRRGVPPERAVQIEAVLGGAVTRAELRPDLWAMSTEAA